MSIRNRVAIALLAAMFSLWTACADTAEDEADGDTLSDDGIEVFPGVVDSGGWMYVRGGAIDGSDDPGDYEVEAAIDGGATVTLNADAVIDDVLAVPVPDDFHTQLGGAGATVRVTTPDGDTIEAKSPIYAVEDNGFGGRTSEPGWGMLGTVYALVQGAPQLPDHDDPCDDPLVPEVPYECPYTTMLVPNFAVPVTPFDQGFPGLSANLKEWFGIWFDGYLVASESGSYELGLCSDDGSRLYLPGVSDDPVIVNDGQHSYQCVGAEVELDAGRNRFKLDYFQGPANEIALEMYWTPPGGASAIIPATQFRLFDEDF
ncbi:MAG: hypothetical protein IT350_05860 [Deltaproteobacteria bacterium]|nr:hypothetical protein [Deltaproteobacteria bacterium]